MAPWMRASGLGLELGAAVAVGTLLGVWIDRRFGTKPWGFLIGFFLGLTGGLYQFIRSSLSANREADEARDEDDRPENGAGT